MSQDQFISRFPAEAWWDRLGIWTSALCVVHCLVTPLLLSFSAAFAHFVPGEEQTHRRLAMLVACFGAIAAFSGFRRHRRSHVLGLVVAGLLLIASGAWLGDRMPNHACEVATTLLGSILTIAGHRRNHTFCGACACNEV